MLKSLKAPQSDSKAWCSQSDRLQMAEDTLSAVRRVRREVVDNMRMLMKAAKDKKSDGMFAIIEEMLRKTKCLCSLLDQSIVEEVFSFLEDNKVTIRPEKDEFSESVAEFMQRNKLKIDLPLICRLVLYHETSLLLFNGCRQSTKLKCLPSSPLTLTFKPGVTYIEAGEKHLYHTIFASFCKIA